VASELIQKNTSCFDASRRLTKLKKNSSEGINLLKGPQCKDQRQFYRRVLSPQDEPKQVSQVSSQDIAEGDASKYAPDVVA
jgi:hypothetical protein